jgi:hypothetical protein
MFILPPNCIVPSATPLTMSPVFPSFLYLISHTPSAANENCDSDCEFAPIQRHNANSMKAPAMPNLIVAAQEVSCLLSGTFPGCRVLVSACRSQE